MCGPSGPQRHGVARCPTANAVHRRSGWLQASSWSSSLQSERSTGTGHKIALGSQARSCAGIAVKIDGRFERHAERVSVPPEERSTRHAAEITTTIEHSGTGTVEASCRAASVSRLPAVGRSGREASRCSSSRACRRSSTGVTPSMGHNFRSGSQERVPAGNKPIAAPSTSGGRPYVCCQLAASAADRLAASSGDSVVWPDAGGENDAIAATSCSIPAALAT